MKKNILHLSLLVGLFLSSSCALREDINMITKTKSPGILVFDKPSSKNNNNRKYPRDNKQYLSNDDLSLIVGDKATKKQNAIQNQVDNTYEANIEKPKKPNFFSGLFSKSKDGKSKTTNEAKKDLKNSGFVSRLFSNTSKKDLEIESALKKDSNIGGEKKIIEKDIYAHEKKHDAKLHHQHKSHKKANKSFPKLDKIPAIPEHFKDSEKLKATLKNDLNDLHNELSKTKDSASNIELIKNTNPVKPIAVVDNIPDILPKTSVINDDNMKKSNVVAPVQLPPPPPPPPAAKDLKTTSYNNPVSVVTQPNAYDPIRFDDGGKDPLVIPDIEKSINPLVNQNSKATQNAPLPSLSPQSSKKQADILVEVVPVNRKMSFYIKKRYGRHNLENDQ